MRLWFGEPQKGSGGRCSSPVSLLGLAQPLISKGSVVYHWGTFKWDGRAGITVLCDPQVIGVLRPVSSEPAPSSWLGQCVTLPRALGVTHGLGLLPGHCPAPSCVQELKPHG